jgi:hypothetical protein
MNATKSEAAAYEGWAILELMGHRRLGGYVRQVEMFGAAMCRIDIPGADDQSEATQFYSGASIYCLTPTTEEVARAVAATNRPAPVQRWELPAPAKAANRDDEAVDLGSDDHGGDDRDDDDVPY